MEYYSTGMKSPRASLHDAVLHSIASDGGLYMPASLPRMPRAFFNNISGLSLQEIAYVVANQLFGGDIDAGVLQRIVNDSLTFDIPLKPVTPDVYSLELFHGPTLGFKDVGARFMARLVSQFSTGKHLNVLVATSGDTGGAVANGFYNVPGVNVYVLFPMQKRNRLQQAQFSMPGGNIHTLLLNATVDECRELVRQVFVDTDIVERMNLISANSLNVARLLPQTFYYFHAYARLPEEVRRHKDVVFAIPCGNLGNLTAAVIAKRMGLPVKRFVAVGNVNSVFADYIRTGTYAPRRTRNTLAPAMDVGDPINFPRILSLYEGNHARLTSEISARSFTDDEIADIIRRVSDEHDYMLDPHGAMAYQAAVDSVGADEVAVFLGTAHPAKFPAEMEAVTGKKIALPRQLRGNASRQRNAERVAPHIDAVKTYLSTRQ